MNTYLVTGVSRGLGLEISDLLLNNNNKVYGISRSISDKLEILIQNYPDNFFWKSFNLLKTDQIKEELFKDFIDFDVQLDGFVNNAAIAYDDIVTNLHQKPLEKMYRINVFSPMMITKNVIRNMLYHRVNGSLVHISSISVHTGYKGLSMYASTKGALEAFSKNTAREWGQRGIRSNCVVSGFMETSMSSSLSEDQKDRIYKRTSLKKATSPRSVAETVHFLLSSQSESITGQNIHVDSGTI